MRQSDRKAWGIVSSLMAQRQVICADLRRGTELRLKGISRVPGQSQFSAISATSVHRR